jgi:hypothetical protein
VTKIVTALFLGRKKGLQAFIVGLQSFFSCLFLYLFVLVRDQDSDQIRACPAIRPHTGSPLALSRPEVLDDM